MMLNKYILIKKIIISMYFSNIIVTYITNGVKMV
jgi:hypothetical protein